MSLLSHFFPQTVAKLSSLYNKEIRINEEKGKLKLLVNGSRQSGAYIEQLWKEAFKEFGLPQSHFQGYPLKILVLGVGGGTVIHMLHAFYPNATILGIDIDQKMLDIGKKYFGLAAINRLRLVHADAKFAIQDFAKKGQRFDLVIIDLYSGRNIPDFVSSRAFLKTVAALLSPTGIAFINFLRELEYREKSDQLDGTLKTIFSNVRDYAIARNRFFCMVK